jgi:hypothetical protein
VKLDIASTRVQTGSTMIDPGHQRIPSANTPSSTRGLVLLTIIGILPL